MSYATDTIHSRCTAQMRYASPLGPLLLARTANGLAGAWFEAQKHHPAPIAGRCATTTRCCGAPRRSSRRISQARHRPSTCP